jgi:hypothetical protein
VGAVKLELAQPSLRREWQFRHGEEVVATLWIPLFRRGAAAEVKERRLMIERAGGIRSEYAVRDTTSNEELARFRPQGLHHVLELGGHVAEWKSLGWNKGHGFVDSDGKPLAKAKVSSGIARTSGQIEVADDLPEQDALVAALVAAYLLIRKAEDASSAAGSTAVVG